MKRIAIAFGLAWLAFGAANVWRASAATTNVVVFLETMATNAVKPWPGTGCNNPWTVTYSGQNPFEQATNANYGSGNPCGLTFKNGTTNLADSAITTALGIDARGNSGTLSFYIEADSLTGNAGWAMQLNPGTGFTTRLTELTASNHILSALHLHPAAGRSGQQPDPADSNFAAVLRAPDPTRLYLPHRRDRHDECHEFHRFICREIRSHPRRQFCHGRPLQLLRSGPSQ